MAIRPASFRRRSRTAGRCGFRSLSRFHGIGKDIDRDFRQVRLLGSPVPRDALSASTLVANVFDGGEKTKVKMVIGDRAPVEMVRTARPDPFVEEVFARNEATKKAWVKANDSSHIWTARLPRDLKPEPIAVVVEAIGEYGQPLERTARARGDGVGRGGERRLAFKVSVLRAQQGAHQQCQRPQTR